MLTRADKNAKNCRDAQGNTPLHLAAYYGQTHCLRQLVRANADVNARNNAQQVSLVPKLCQRWHRDNKSKTENRLKFFWKTEGTDNKAGYTAQDAPSTRTFHLRK